jgi:hypothetical protein
VIEAIRKFFSEVKGRMGVHYLAQQKSIETTGLNEQEK